MTTSNNPAPALEPQTGSCCECGAPCTDSDLVGNGMEQDGLGSWPRYWCGSCINKHLEEDAKKAKG